MSSPATRVGPREAAWEHTLECIHGDAARRGIGPGLKPLARLVISSSSMRYQVVLRLVKYHHAHHPRSFRHLALRVAHRRMTIRYGYEIPLNTDVGPGLLLRHLGPIIVHQDTILGRNVNLNSGVVIGRTYRGANAGVPRLGDNVYVGPGAKVIGGITIGNHAAIGTNAVVTHDVPDHGVVAGIPARIISMAGSTDYVNNPC